MLELSKEQSEALDAVVDWKENGAQTLTFGGYAGTGKTTLIGFLQRIFPDLHIVYVSFTGKAVSVMKRKLPAGSETSTIHRLLYRPMQKLVCVESGEDVKWVGGQCDLHLGRIYPPGEEEVGNRPCETRKSLDWQQLLNPLDGIDLVVVDEASMVSEKLWTDLTKWGVPVLAVGDHGQLPPVKSEFNLMRDPQIRLETIHRQAEGSPIIQMATLARTTGHIPLGEYGPGCVKVPPFHQGRVLPKMHPERGDLALCSFHRTRTVLNQQLRERLLGRRDPRLAPTEPVIGDIVICGRNNYTAGVFNGQRGFIRELGPAEVYVNQRFAGIELMDEDYYYEGEIATEPFGKEKVAQSDYPRRVGIWDYGYALTVHRSQGSQADRVLVIEERFPRDGDDFHARLLYTAVTRAVRSLCVVGPR